MKEERRWREEGKEGDRGKVDREKRRSEVGGRRTVPQVYAIQPAVKS